MAVSLKLVELVEPVEHVMDVLRVRLAGGLKVARPSGHLHGVPGVDAY